MDKLTRWRAEWMPGVGYASGFVDETDKGEGVLPCHNLMHRGRIYERHQDFLACRCLVLDKRPT